LLNSLRNPIVFLLTAILLFSLFPFATFVASIPLIEKQWGLINTEVGAISGVYFLGYVLGAILLVPISDKYSTKNTLFFAVSVSAFSHLAFSIFANGLLSALLLRFISGAAFSGVYVIGQKIIGQNTSAESRGSSIGLYVTGFYAGGGLSLLLAGYLLLILSWETVYLLVSCISIMSVLLALIFIIKIDLLPTNPGSAFINPKVLLNKKLFVASFSYAMHAWELYIMRMWFPVFLAYLYIESGSGLNSSASLAATIAGIISIVASFTPLLGASYSDGKNRAKIAIVILAISSVLSLIIGLTVLLPIIFAIIIGFIWTLFVGSDSAIYTTLITENAKPEELGSSLAVHTIFAFGTAAISPLVFGIILDIFGRNELGWFIGFFTSSVCALFAMLFLYLVYVRNE
jgi:MFS family permease|tara:strand:+ start:86 stop:1291 length:1206 start_codon:yes stop_codon:yes gene_type:complete